MKIDKSRVRKSTSEVPNECQQLIELLQQCSGTELLDELSKIHSWTFGKCELLHWAQVLDIFDAILGAAAETVEDNKWSLKCDTFCDKEKQLVTCILRFTSLLIEHSFSRHLYNSMEHLLALLKSNDMVVVLEVLNLLYMFSKRSNFITRLKTGEKDCLLTRLQYLAESWGGKDNGFGLADCCNPDKEIPNSATTLHVEFHKEDSIKTKKDGSCDSIKTKTNLNVIHIEHINKLYFKTPAEIMQSLVNLYSVPPEKEMWLFTHVRLATHFADYEKRLKCVQARLQALSVLVYSNAIQDSPPSLLYTGLLEELVEVIELQNSQLTDIRCAALRTLTAIIHLDRNPQFPNRRIGSRLSNIIEVTGASQYHGFLPVLVRNCITSLTTQHFPEESDANTKIEEIIIISSDEASNPESKTTINCGNNAISDGNSGSAGKDIEETQSAFQAMTVTDPSKFPVSLTTALFSFLYHLASYDVGGEALVCCGMMESLLQVISWQGFELDHITFVTRAVRVIDLITNIDMLAFHSHGGLHSFINRLHAEVKLCKKDQPFRIRSNSSEPNVDCSPSNIAEDSLTFTLECVTKNMGKSCLPQRAALLKSMLNFLKKAFQDSAFAENIRHLMEGPLPSALKNIIANAEYYGPSLFLLATDVVTVYVYQEPTLLSTLQDNGLTDVVLYSLLLKEIPATREVLGSLPNVFSALCLNAHGLELFELHKPFNKLFHILLSPTYLTAMRRRRSSEPSADTASNLGNAMDELMRHQPSLRQDATLVIVSLLEELVQMGTNPNYVCWKPHSRNEPTGNTANRAPPTEGSSDEEEEDEDETSTSSQNATAQNENTNQNSNASVENERQSIALIDYILNTMKFIDAILSNNSTDDHCREFIIKGGIPPLLRLLGLPNLPADCPANNPAQAVATVCKSILSLAQEPFIFQEGLRQLNQVLETLEPLSAPVKESDGSVADSKLLMELAGSDITTAFNCAESTPLLHAMAAAHGYVLMFVHVCRTGQIEIRNLSLLHWGSEEGVKVLQGLSNLYTALVWESTLLLAYCSDDLMFSECDFTRESIEKLNQFFDKCETTQGLGGDSTNHLGTESNSGNAEPESSSSDLNKLGSRNLKYIKSLLGASSRLGRALAELFGLLVKLCVGPPVRQRRNQHIASPPLPSPQARKVAHALNSLLVKALDCDSLPPSPTLKCRLTFLICSIGFASPMLFDERRYPYYLMLEKFVSVGGLSVFFKTFKWAMDIADLDPADTFPEGLFGFLDSWLTLLEKMVNSKAVLESPHVISSRPNRTYYFDVIKYLTQVHRLAFDSIQRLWERTVVSIYGNRITETILVILKHIYVDETILKEKLKQEEQKEEQSPTNSTFTVRENGDNLRQLVDMGFSREDAIDALLNSTNLEQATDYLLTYPPHLRLPSSAKETESDDASPLEVEEPLSIAGCSLDNPRKNMADLEIALDKFSDDILKLCVDFLFKMPDLIHKACDLLVTIMKRNGTTFRNNLLESLSNNITLSGRYLTTRIMKMPKMMPEILLNEAATSDECSERLCNFMHMFILFYEPPYYYEMKIPPLTIYGTPALSVVTGLLKIIEEFRRETYKEGCLVPTPKWLAFCMLLLDTYARVANRTDRKNKMHISTGRVWRWYDLVAGKWTYYSQSNNKLINDAYWSGEQSVKVTCGRRRYTITFQTMLQMNDETLNKRPVAMVLLSQMHTSCSNIDEEPPEDALFEELSHTERNRCQPVPHLSKMEIHRIVRLCASLLHLPLDNHTLHAVLQICVRFTRNYEMAKLFVECGGIRCLLNMKHINDFGGFAVLSTILIRHALEEPGVLAFAMERVVRARALATIPPAYRDLVYLMRQLGAVVTRDPALFFQVAEANLKVDTTPAKSVENLDSFPIKVDPPATKSKTIQFQESTSFEVIYELLDALLKPLDETRKDSSSSEYKTSKDKSTVKEMLTKKKIGKDATTKEGEKSSSSANEKDDRGKPMLTKSVILKILSDAVVSYAPVAKLITDYIYRANCCEIIKEDTTVLAFIFDKILPQAENISDLDCTTMCRMLIASLSAANLCPEVQSTLVNEVKMALNRALLLPESLEKHSQIQNICSVISAMIDHCPSHGRVINVLPPNNIIKIMLRRGLLNDLAKIPHFLELSSPHTPFTANASLKPLESLSRTINQPSQNTNTAKGRKSNNGSTEDSSNVSTEPTGRLEEEDSENVEDAQLENTLDRVANDPDNTLEEIMEQILEGGPERDRNASMELDEEGPLTYDPERDATEELMSTDSGESDSNPSDQAEDEGNNDDDGDDDNMDDNDDNEDNNYDDDNSARDRRNRDSELADETSGLFRVSTYDRDEDVLMIHYERENDTALPRMIRWNENGYTVPMLEDNSGDHAIIHPLLLTRYVNESNQNSTPRTQRINRARRYQYLFNPRHPNPPVILQRLLGTHDPHAMANMMTANNILSAPVDIAREQARVVIMDNFGLIPSNEEQIDFVDQSGYLFGPSLAATLSHVPPVVHWWNMETKLLDVESVFDCTSWICNRLLPRLLKTRNADLRYKKFKDEEEKAKKRKSKSEITNPFHGFDSKAQQQFSGLNFDSEDPHSLIFQYNRLMEGQRQIRECRRPTGSQERDQDSSSRAVGRQALVINYPSDSSSGDSTSNRTRETNQPVVNELRVALTDVLVNPPTQDDDDSDDDVGVDIDPVILSAGFQMPNNILADLNAATDTDRATIEVSSDNSLNFSTEANHGEDGSLQDAFTLSPSQINFLRNENSNSNDSSSAVPLQPGIREIVIERSEDSNSQPEINLSENVPTEQHSERVRTVRQIEPVTLQAIFEQTINQQIEGLSGGVDLSQAEGASSNISVGQNSSTRDSMPNQRDQASGTNTTLRSEFGSSASSEEYSRSQRLQFPGPSHARDDEEIPEGVDPSFLEALPPEIRREVIEQHQILCLQQRLAARPTATTGAANVVAAAVAAVTAPGDGAAASSDGPQEVSPEFLAALPPSLQEEVLTQQRLEQQRQAAARAPPYEPVDAQAFFQTLQPSLRTMILSDMEDSQMSALPPELAAEAQTLRRDWYARNRQLAQERYLQRNLPAIIRHTRGGRQAHRPITFQRGGSWGALCRDFTSNTNRPTNTPANNVKVRGRQLLDLDSIACLLILLFTDDPHLNKLRLSRVIRNLCFHGPTREWIINALLTIVDKSVNCKLIDRRDPNIDNSANAARAGPFTSKLQTDIRHLNSSGHWLTIRMEAALGCAASVFLINKEPGKKADRISGYNVIDIHPQAAPIVCRNTLDLLIALAKAFPQCLLPIKLFREDMLERSTTPVKPNPQSQFDFWDILLKLDSAAAKKGKSIAKSSAAPISNDNEPFSFENSVFGRLLEMLGSPHVLNNTQLTDHILKVLSVTTTCMPELKSHRFKKSSSSTVTTGVVNNSHINILALAVNAITYKNCSVEGLEYITNMLLNIASSSQDISLGILNLLLEGASKIGVTVETQIKNMLVDLKDLDNLETKRSEENIPSTSKGIIYNRFTNEQVVITASTKIKSTCELQLPSMVPLTSKSSSQTFFLRVLRVIVQIRNSFKNNIKRSNSEGELPALSEQLSTLESLWDTLSKCLFELEHAPDHHAVLVLQPAVEAFFLVHSPQQAALSHKTTEKTEEAGSQRTTAFQPQPPTEISTADTTITIRPNSLLALATGVTVQTSSSSTNEDYRTTSSISNFDFEHRQSDTSVRVVTPEQQKFLAFAEKHRTVLNQILRQSTAHLADGPFAVLVDHTRILDFDIKRRYFRTELERMDHGVRREETAVHVRRSNVFEDSFRELFRRAPEEWKNRFYIVFEDEEGQDAGGLLREWYVIISRDIFNPMYALFTVSPGDRVTYMINSASHYNSNHLCYYKFVGRVIAKAIYDNKLLECYFTRSFYKHILGISVKYTDMESEDYSFYRGLVYLMENNINNLGLDLTFSTEISEFGVTETRDLIPNGRYIAVTEENKMEYVRLVCQMKMTGAIKQQLTAFLEGFYDIIPMRLISIFNEQELELLISGLPNIDIDDLKANTEYHKYQSNSLQIQWFWRALRSFDQADRAKFLQFVTGTSKVPLQGFSALEGMNGVQKFQIHRDDRCTDRLPSAHTCFNQLDLPVYETYDKLRAYLLKAIHECSEGFGFA